MAKDNGRLVYVNVRPPSPAPPPLTEGLDPPLSTVKQTHKKHRTCCVIHLISGYLYAFLHAFLGILFIQSSDVLLCSCTTARRSNLGCDY